MIEVLSLGSYSKALMLKELLQNEGIEIVIKKKDLVTSTFQGESGVFKIYVDEKDEENVKEILSSIELGE